MAIWGNDVRFYQTVKDPSAVAQVQRSVLKFTGSPVTVSDTAGETVVDITPGADTDFYQTVKDPAGVAQTQRSVLKFTGSAVSSVSDVGGETVVDVESGSVSPGDITVATQVIEADVSANHTLANDTAEHVRVTTNYAAAVGSVGILVTYEATYENDGSDNGVLKLNLYVNGSKVRVAEIGSAQAGGQFEVLQVHFSWFVTAPSTSSVTYEVREQRSDNTSNAWTDLALAVGGAKLTLIEWKK